MAITLIQPFNLDATKDYTFANTTATGNTTANNLLASNIVTATGNVIGSNLLTGGNVSATGNAIANNVNIGNIISAGGNITGANLITVGLATITGNVIANNFNAGNIISAGGNITGANLITSGVISATANITTANFFIGNGFYLTGITSGVQDKIANGNSNVYIPTANGNVTITTSGNANVVVVTGTGVNIAGYSNITGNANIGNIGTGVLTATGNITGANFNTVGKISATGNIETANYFIGNGAFLTGVSTSSNSIFDGNSNVLVSANSNISMTVAGNSNVIVVTGTGANINGYANVTGNANIGNIGTGIVTATGNITGNNLNAGNIISAGGNITGDNISAAGNVTANNVNVGNIISATGNITGSYILGNGAFLTGIAAGVQDKIANGNSNVFIPTANGNVTITAVGNANVVVITGTGANITGTANISGNITTASNISATGNITGNVFIGNGSGLTNLAGANVTGQVGNALIAGTVYTNAQPNITSVGTLTGLTVGPNSSVILSGNTGFVRANSIQGRDGSQAIYPYYGNVSGAVGIVTDLTVGTSGGGNLTVANGNAAFSGANVSLGNVSNLHISGGTLNYFLKTDGSGNLSWALPSASPGGAANELQFNDTGVFAGSANLTYDSTEYRLSIQNYSLVVQTLGGISGATTINITDGCYVTATSAGITTWIFTFPAPTDNASGFVLELTNGGTYTQNWPLSVRWPGGSAPDLTATGVDVLVFVTNDNGITWRGAVSMLDST